MTSMSLQQVSEHCYAVLNDKNRICDANSGIIAIGDGVIVDTQCDLRHAQELRSMAAELGIKKPKYVVNTHEDADHVLGNQVFRDCEIVAHKTVPDRMQTVADPVRLQQLSAAAKSLWKRLLLKMTRPGLLAVADQLAEDLRGAGLMARSLNGGPACSRAPREDGRSRS